MKRHTVLQPLSRQHHSLLLAVLLLKKGIAKKTENIILSNFVQQLWEQEFMPHFYQEENILIPVVRIIVPEEMSEKIITEHNIVRKQYEEILKSPTYELLGQFVQCAELNIRNEERIYFNEIQQHFTVEIAKILSLKIKESDASCIHFKPAFWE